MTTNDEIFLLIDSHAIIHRAYHAFPPTLTTSKGEQVNAVYGFALILLEVLNKFKPKYVVCAFDSKGPTQRHDMYVGYKANRAKPDDDLLNQIPRINELVEAFGIPIFRQSGFEADDIIGTIVKQKDLKKIKKIIVTGDQDIFQLINDEVNVYISGSKFAASKLFDADAVKEKFTFGPEHIVDYKSLRGDPSDNIPGVKGIGEKGAKDLIVKFGDLNSIYKSIDEVEPKGLQNKLIDGHELAVLSHKLATIITDVPMNFSLRDSVFAGFDGEKVKELFVELEFRSLVGKIPDFSNKPDGSKSKSIQNQTVAENPDVNYKLLQTGEEIDKFLEQLEKQKIFCFDLETTGLDIYNSQVIGIAFSWEEKTGCFMHLGSKEFVEQRIIKLREIFENPKIRKVAHNIKYDAELLYSETVQGVKLNIVTQNFYFDTLIAAYVLKGGSGSLGLKNMAFNEFGMEMTELADTWQSIPGFKPKAKYSPKEVRENMLASDIDVLAKYACADVDATWRLFKRFDSQFENPNGEQIGLLKNSESKTKKLFFEIEMPLIEVLIKMEREGIKLDSKYIVKFSSELDARINSISKEIFTSVGHEFNISSPKQVGEVLFGELNLPFGKKTKTGAWQTNEFILKGLADAHPMVALLLEYRELSKLRSTYTDSLIAEINPTTGKIHTNYNQCIASTGRLSSINPNLQNIPVASEMGMKIREGFVADDDCIFVSFDISQQELRILAHMSGEEQLIDAYMNDRDVHALTASKIFKIPVDEVSSEQRAKGKTLNFSLIYGISAFGLSQRLKIPRAEAQQLITDYFTVYPKVKLFFDQLLTGARASGRVETLFGRYRETSGLNSSNFAIRGATEREVINFPIQGTAADMVKIAMRKCFDFITSDRVAKDFNAKMILQVHDELVFQMSEKPDHKSKREALEKKIKEIIENSVKLKVPVKVGIKEGRHWGELK